MFIFCPISGKARCRPYLHTFLLLIILAIAGCKGMHPCEIPTRMPEDFVRLEELDLSHMVQDWQRPGAGKSVNGTAISIGGTRYEHGLGSHSASILGVRLNEEAAFFEALVGVNDEVGLNGSVIFQVWLDGKKVFQTDTIIGGQPAVPVRVDCDGAREALFVIAEGPGENICDHADWAEAKIHMKYGTDFRPFSIPVLTDAPPVIASGVPALPRINGPRIYGATPGRSFLYRIPATGEGPLIYHAEHLPDGLILDPQTGIISGVISEAGTTDVMLGVTGRHGNTHRKLRIVAGDHKLALTPPMGWNSWNVWGPRIDAARIRDAADGMIRSGLADHGYQYINVDDAWEGERDGNGVLHANENFGDMKELGDYIHSLGLKFGIYSSPGPETCQGKPGSYGHEFQDAQTFSSWGVDFLKYDWCSYGSLYSGTDRAELMKPYRIMREALDRCDRDIIFSICQYGHGNVWEWGPMVHGNCWRTTGDIADMWGSIAGIGFNQTRLSPYAKPGHWNDPDMLVVGVLGWGQELRQCKLSRHEQITHMTLWTMLAAPMLLGCDLSQMDDFTLALLTNDEVIEINQDPLGKQALLVRKEDELETWARPLWDGTHAVAFFNRGPVPANIGITWKELGFAGEQPVRDLWKHEELGLYHDGIALPVAARGCVLLKVGKPLPTEY